MQDGAVAIKALRRAVLEPDSVSLLVRVQRSQLGEPQIPGPVRSDLRHAKSTLKQGRRPHPTDDRPL